MISNGKTTIFKRQGATQQEYYDDAKTPTSYTVKWINDCSFSLTPKADVFKKYPNIPKNAVLMVHIIKTTKDSYTQICRFNFSSVETTYLVKKIK